MPDRNTQTDAITLDPKKVRFVRLALYLRGTETQAFVSGVLDRSKFDSRKHRAEVVILLGDSFQISRYPHSGRVGSPHKWRCAAK